MNTHDFFDDVIVAYTRSQATTDGVLIEVTSAAREAGIRFPVAETSALWHGLIVPTDDLRLHGQSTDGRLWDVLWMLRWEAKHAGTASVLAFQVIFLTLQGGAAIQRTETLKAVCGPGDRSEPVITIMLAHED